MREIIAGTEGWGGGRGRRRRYQARLLLLIIMVLQMMVVMVMVMVIGMVIGMGTMVIISGRSSLADAKSNDNLLPGDAFHIHNTITNTITVMKVIHYIVTPPSSPYCR